MGICEKYVNKDYFYFVFRVFVGLLFLQHGLQKLFGAFGGSKVELVSKMGLAGGIEFFGGLLVAVGLYASLAALVAILELVYAYATVHGQPPTLHQTVYWSSRCRR